MSHAQDSPAEPVRAANDAEVRSQFERPITNLSTRFIQLSSDLRFVEQRQLALSATRSALIRVQAEQRVQRLNLHLALGGRFEVVPPTPTAPRASGLACSAQ